MLTNTMKNDLVQGLLDIFHSNITMIILYGSVARNEATDSSDIDIAIIMLDIVVFFIFISFPFVSYKSD